MYGTFTPSLTASTTLVAPTIGGGRTQVDTTALTGGGFQATTGRGNVSGQSDVSHMIPAHSSCLNATNLMGAHNKGQSLAITKFKDAVNHQLKEVAKWEENGRIAHANMQIAISKGKTERVRHYQHQARKWSDKAQDARARLVLLQTALTNCVASGYSSGSAPAVTPPAGTITGTTTDPIFTKVSKTPVEEVAAAQDVVVTEVVTPTGEVVTAAVNGNGEVVAVSSAAPTLMDGGVLSTKNIALGLLALGIGYTILKRKG